jgi:hypothetical protein
MIKDAQRAIFALPDTGGYIREQTSCAALATAAVFLEPRTRWVEATAIRLGVFVIMSVALVGVEAGGKYYERHLTIMLFVAVSAIIIFPVPLEWTISVAVAALGLFLGCNCRIRMSHKGARSPERCYLRAVSLLRSSLAALRTSLPTTPFCSNCATALAWRI